VAGSELVAAAMARQWGREFFLCFPKIFAECRFNTRQNLLPSAQKKAHGKSQLWRPAFAVSGLPSATPSKAFAVCNPGFAVCTRHTVNMVSPVVLVD
jgi:hypothetical protein